MEAKIIISWELILPVSELHANTRHNVKELMDGYEMMKRDVRREQYKYIRRHDLALHD